LPKRTNKFIVCIGQRGPEIMRHSYQGHQCVASRCLKTLFRILDQQL
jgi:hypothetical protein